MTARYAVAFGALLVLVVPFIAAAVVFLASNDSGDEAPGSEMAFSEDEIEPVDLSEERAAFLDDVDLEDVTGKLAPADAITALEPLLSEHGENAHLHYLLGRAYADSGQVAAAMKHYDSAVGFDVRYAAESRIISDARRAFSDKSDETSSTAEPLLTTLLASPAAPTAEDVLFETAIDGAWATRKRARELLKTTGRWDTLPEWKHHAINLGLVGKKSCAQGLKHVRALAAAGEPGALPALEKAARRPKQGCGFLNKSDCYKCMRADLQSTIRKLESANGTGDTAD